MEGTLWKWTNYFSGWQPRWFVLDNGILSYYRSQDDVNNGCKGSIKMSVCDVTVHPTDSSRLDLSIPGEAHFYVKAATAQERQQWLVALGTSKACLANGRPMQPTEELPEEQIKSKKSELRLYCDLLMQQVHSVKTAVQDKDAVNVGTLDEATSLLSATCDTFIKTLDDCLILTHANTSQTPPSPTRKSPSIRTSTVPWNQSPVQRSTSVENHRSFSRSNSVNMDGDIVRGYIPNTSQKSRGTTPVGSNYKRSRNLSDSSDSRPENSSVSTSISSPEEGLNNGPSPSLQLKPVPRISFGDLAPEILEKRVPTFFTKMPVSFMDIKLEENGGIPTLSFLDACRAILPIFDKLNPTAFAPIKLDVAGNIRKIQQKYSANPDHCQSLQDMVLYEVQNKQHMNSNSATVALLWLKRGVEYIREFLWDFLTGVEDLTLAANNAYGKTLKQFHSFVVRGVFALAVKSAPSKKEFMEHLAANRADLENSHYELFLLKDVEDYVTAQDVLTKILSDFYANQDLDLQEQV